MNKEARKENKEFTKEKLEEMVLKVNCNTETTYGVLKKGSVI